MNGYKRYIQKRVNRDKTDFATKARMLGLPASAGAPALAATGGRATSATLVHFGNGKKLILPNIPIALFDHFVKVTHFGSPISPKKRGSNWVPIVKNLGPLCMWKQFYPTRYISRPF